MTERADARRPDTGVAGVVLAGGRSTRFAGADKALARLADRPVVTHVVDAIEPVVSEVVINCRHDQRDALERALGDRVRTFAVDPITDRGPVAGLRTGLRATDARYAVVVACDMPLVRPGVLSHLLVRARTATGAVGELGGEPRPLPAVVHVRAALCACTDTVNAGTGQLREFVERLDPVVVAERDLLAFAPRDAFLNVNTREDLRAAGERV